MGRILTIAHLTFIEACRRKIVPAALLCSVLFLLVYGTALYFINRNIPTNPQRQFQLQFFTLAGLYVANFLAIAAAVLLPVDTLSGEIDSGVMQTLASKPIRRAEIVIGKWLTYWLMTGSYLVIIAGGVVVVARLTMGFVQQHLAPGAAADAARCDLHADGLDRGQRAPEDRHERHRRVRVLRHRVHRRLDRANRRVHEERRVALRRHRALVS